MPSPRSDAEATGQAVSSKEEGSEELTSPEKARARKQRYRERQRANQKSSVRAEQALLETIEAAKQERAGLDALHGAMLSLERHQRELLQAGSLAAAFSKEEVPPPWFRTKSVEVPKPIGLLAAARERTVRLLATFREVFCSELYLKGLFTPTDEQLRDYMVVCGDKDFFPRFELHRRALVPMLAQWEAGANRAVIESRANHIFQMRLRSIRCMLEHRPDLLLQTFSLFTPAPESEYCEERSTLSSCPLMLHSSLEFIAELEWTDDQRDRLRPVWGRYQERVQACRQQTRSHVDGLRGAGGDVAVSLSAWDTLPANPLEPVATAYVGVVDSLGGVDAWIRLEVAAWVELTVGFVQVMTTIQNLRLTVHSLPYVPDPVQIVNWLLQ